MLIFKKIQDLQKYLQSADNKPLTQGFVPTMGALHAGHLSLISKSKTSCRLTVCSIFVNPTQFNDKTDFDKYPNTIDSDIVMLSQAGCDVLFLPSVKEMYPQGLIDATPVDFGYMAQTLEGEHRPGHFGGMAQVVERLLRIVKPDKLYMGQKDYQQQLIVSQLIKKRRLNTQLVMSPTEREKDGLAMSSRNVRLDTKARALSVELSKTLKTAKREIRNTKYEVNTIIQRGSAHLQNIPGIDLEYFEIRNAETLKPVTNKKEKMVALVAAKIGGVRLIDNMVL
ncbi:MAG TPA: pantoate--beta-alanine ligase [Chitinophagales bacterium]|nr:pantoate--beta-alanine ligase [Chitinophagales bacterium]